MRISMLLKRSENSAGDPSIFHTVVTARCISRACFGNVEMTK